jgi:hypothetical protein
MQPEQPDIGAVLNASPSDIRSRSRFQLAGHNGPCSVSRHKCLAGQAYRAALRQKRAPPDQHDVSEHAPHHNHRHLPNAPRLKLRRVTSLSGPTVNSLSGV